MLRTLPLCLAVLALTMGGCRVDIDDDDPTIVTPTRHVHDDPDTVIIREAPTIIERDAPDVNVDVRTGPKVEAEETEGEDR